MRDENCTWASAWTPENGLICVKILKRATVLCGNEQVLSENRLESHDHDTYLCYHQWCQHELRQSIRFCIIRSVFPQISIRAILKLATETSIRSSITNHRLRQQEFFETCWNLFTEIMSTLMRLCRTETILGAHFRSCISISQNGNWTSKTEPQSLRSSTSCLVQQQHITPWTLWHCMGRTLSCGKPMEK